MKKLLAIIVLGLLFSGNAYSDSSSSLLNIGEVNKFLKEGWKLYAIIGDNESGFSYHLTRKNELITCGMTGTQVACFKP